MINDSPKGLTSPGGAPSMKAATAASLPEAIVLDVDSHRIGMAAAWWSKSGG